MRFDWSTRSGEARSAEAWIPPEPARAVVVCLHGMSGYSDQFAPLASGMPGNALYAPELRGQSGDPDPSRRGVVLDLPGQHQDIAEFLSVIAGRHPGLPVFLLGESMAALIASSFLAANPSASVAGAIFSVPVVALLHPVPVWVTASVRWIAAAAPRLRCPPSVFVNGKSHSPPLTRDQRYQIELGKRPGHLRSYTFRFLADLGALIEQSQTLAAQIQVPCLTLAAGKDCFVRVDQIEAWFQKIPADDKTLSIYPESYHLLWQDWESSRVIADIAAWIKKRAA